MIFEHFSWWKEGRGCDPDMGQRSIRQANGNYMAFDVNIFKGYVMDFHLISNSSARPSSKHYCDRDSRAGCRIHLLFCSSVSHWVEKKKSRTVIDSPQFFH